jgi:hypothetical protein
MTSSHAALVTRSMADWASSGLAITASHSLVSLLDVNAVAPHQVLDPASSEVGLPTRAALTRRLGGCLGARGGSVRSIKAGGNLASMSGDDQHYLPAALIGGFGIQRRPAAAQGADRGA